MSDIEVTGIPENKRALKEAGELDIERAGTEAARNLLPYIRENTRVDTGALESGWEASGGKIINEVDYASYQEYGTQFVDPMNAIGKATDEHEDVILDAFGKESERAADKAGLGGQRPSR